MIELIVFIVVMVAAGYALRATKLVREEAARDLNQTVFFLALPPLIFQALHRATLSWSMLSMPGVAWLSVFLGVGLGVLFGRVIRLPKAKAGAFILAFTFGNTTYLGYPYVRGFYGTHHLTLAIFFDLLGATIGVNTVGPAIAGFASGKAVHPLDILKRLLGFPPLYAMILGLALHGVALPGWLDMVLDRLGNLTSPLIMLSIGLSLELGQLGQDWPLVLTTALGRLFVLPLLVWGLVRSLHLPVDYQQAAVMQSAMPTMFYTLALSLLFELEISFAVNSIMISTLLSFVTLPLWHYLLG